MLATEKAAVGDVVPTPTFPFLSIMKYEPVDEPTEKGDTPADVFTDNVENGVVVPIPTIPLLLITKLVLVLEPTTN